MKKLIIIIGAVLAAAVTHAQNNAGVFSQLPPAVQVQLLASVSNTPTPATKGSTTITITVTTNASGGLTVTTNANPPSSAASKMGGVLNAIQIISGKLASATNWGVVPYASIGADKSNKGKVGGGVLALYNFNQFIGTGIGVDYLGTLTMVSANVQLELPLQPFLFINTNGFFGNFTMTPFVYSGLGTALGGTSGSSVVTHEGEGVNIDLFTLGSGWKFGGGVAFIERQNAGKYSGNYINPFLAFRKGF